MDNVETAVAIRKHLKTVFPGTKFSVRATKASQCSCVDVYYEDGPAQFAVDTALAQFKDPHRSKTFFVDAHRKLTLAGRVKLAKIHGRTVEDMANGSNHLIMATDLRESANVVVGPGFGRPALTLVAGGRA